ncbi:MAG: DUF192 domain-containing protein [Cyanobacteria bacterium]|nr:DUF192 domain-containing protein [Cyanobacteriota bacterium]
MSARRFTQDLSDRLLIDRSLLLSRSSRVLGGCILLFTAQLLLVGCAATQSPVTNPTDIVSTIAATSSSTGTILPITAKITIAGKPLNLEVARSPQEQATGLMYRPALPDDRGMLFPMTPARPVTFWMRNVPVALDMVFLYQGKVKAIASSVPPCTTPECPVYGPPGDVDNVLELRSGRALELEIKVGDEATILPNNTSVLK